MISNTPVIVIATNDHKVKTGTEWFKGIYANSQYNADSLDEAYSLAMNIVKTNNTIVNKPYFKTEYYDKLKSRFEIVDWEGVMNIDYENKKSDSVLFC